VLVTLSLLVGVSLATPPSPESKWEKFFAAAAE
jgi:hypothetical protein